MTTTADSAPLVLTRRGAYVHYQAAALRAGDAGDKAAQRAAWNAGTPYAVHLTLGEMLECSREARHLVDGVPVLPMTDEELRTAKRGTQVFDSQGRVWTKANTRYHRRGGQFDGGDNVVHYWLNQKFGPIYPARAPR